MSGADAPPEPPAGFDPRAAETMSAFVSAMGARITDWSENRCRIETPIRAGLINRHGLVHGGVYATLLDTALGYAGCHCPYPGRIRRALTLSLTTQFLGSASEADGALIAEARRSGGGKTVFFAEGTVTLASGALCATGVGTFRYRGRGGEPFGDPAEGAPAEGAPTE